MQSAARHFQGLPGGMVQGIISFTAEGGTLPEKPGTDTEIPTEVNSLYCRC